MNPQAQTTPVLPQPNTVNPQGVTSVSPNTPAQTSAIPQGPAIGPPMTPPQNPNYDPSAAMADIANYYNIPREAALTAGQTQAQGNIGQQEYQRGEAQKQLQVQNAQNSLDSSKYTVTQNAKSPYGLQIVGPLGNSVSFQDYINLTGANPAQVLAQSTDKQAQQFVSAYNNLENFMQTTLQASGGSEQAKIQLADYYQANPGLQSMTPQQVTNAFMSQYGEFFGQPQTQQPGQTPGVGATIQSAQSPTASSPYYEMQQYPQLAQPNPIATSLLGGGSPASGGGNSAVASQLQQLLQQQQAANQGL